jgi:hypothetical protein
VNGKAGSGKTSVVLDLLLRKKPRIYRKNVHKIFFFAPESSLASIAGNPINSESVSHLYHDLTPEILTEAIELARQYHLQGMKSMFVLDDFAAVYKDHDIEQLLKQIVYNRRHMGIISIIMLTQIYYAIPMSLRRAATMLYIFKPTNKRESNAIMEEISGISKEQFDSLIKHVFHNSNDTSRFNFMLFIPDILKIFKNYNQLLTFSDDTSGETDKE